AVKTELPPPLMDPLATRKRSDPFSDERWIMALNTGTITPDRPADRAGALSVPRADPIVTSQAPADATNAGNGSRVTHGPATRPEVQHAADRSYTVKPGDSLARIAEEVYGSQVYFKAIQQANPQVDPMKLKPGMVLRLPEPKAVKARGGHDDDSPPPPVDSAAEYRVVAGDSLSRIAIKLYGNPARWEEIYELNKAKIGADPARLKVGMVLTLPAAPTHRD
ncbi:MAG: LysM peptidoglycan-binding domain-containing protein, partial [Phycisphaerales bacterium]|nr:LysM peptidoglycan-binding domain-containing protein [Phycisphaerales bacterium]